jgi:apolipoprotein N-acyltransferase
MGSRPSTTILVTLCLSFSAVLFFLGTGLTPTWACTWLAPIPVLWIAPRVRTGEAFLIATSAHVLGGLNEWSYSRTVLPTVIVASILLVVACLFGLGVLLFRMCLVRRRLWQAALVLPAYWVTIEYLASVTSIHGTFGNLGYSQMNFLPAIQITSITGIWGISFCIFLFAGTIAAVLSAAPGSQRIPLAVGAMLFLALVFGFAAWRLATTPKNSPAVKLALIASSSPDDIFASTPAQAQAIFERYAEQVRRMGGRGVQLFLLPEHLGPVTDSSLAEADGLFAQLAQQTGAYIAVGIDRIGGTVSRNQQRLYSPTAGLVAAYNKHHLLPRFEDQFTPDTNRSVVANSSGKWGLEICKDLDFPRLSREYSQDGVGLLLVSAMDFVEDGWLHGRMAVLRGVESGFSIARSAKLGILTATDDRGHVLAERETIGGPAFATAIAVVPVRHELTMYSRRGDWFAWLCVVVFPATLLLARKSSSAYDNYLHPHGDEPQVFNPADEARVK